MIMIVFVMADNTVSAAENNSDCLSEPSELIFCPKYNYLKVNIFSALKF